MRTLLTVLLMSQHKFVCKWLILGLCTCSLSATKVTIICQLNMQVRMQLFWQGGGVHFKLGQTSCQQSLKYISLYNMEGAPFSTEKRNFFLCT